MSLSVTVLGCSGTYAGPGGACSGYLVADGQTRVWLDAGPGTLGNLQLHCGLDELDAIIITHEHPDHWLELPVVANALRYHVERAATMPVYTTKGAASKIRELSHSPRADLPFDLHEVRNGDRVTIGSLDVSFSQTQHYVRTHAVRIASGDRSMAFSADTGPDWSFDAFDQPIDLALCEASMDARDEENVQHLTAAEAARVSACADRLVITHIAPGTDEAAQLAQASASFDGLVEVAQVGARFNI